MKKIKWTEWLICLSALCLALSGCADGSLMEEAPRDFVLMPSDMAETEAAASVGEASEPVSEASASEALVEAGEEPESDYSFLWEGADSYAFDSLSEAEQIWYRDMETILGCHLEEQPLSEEGLSRGLDETCIDHVFQCVLNDHPELFYVEGYAYTKFTRGDSITSIAFSGTYNADLETAKEKERQIQDAVLQILSGISEAASDYDKVKYVYDTLIRETDYELNSSDNQNIYSVFVNHASVCQGYAKATQYLLNRLGVACTLVLGNVDTGEGHAWNLVQVDGSYYYVDTTWGDASYQQEEGTTMQLAMPEINYDYLNVTTAELLRTHTIGGNVPMPACVATEANYYVKEGALFTSYDREQMAALFSGAVAQGREDVTVKCADADCYEEVLNALIENQEIFSFLSTEGNSIAYAQNEKQLSLTFWVTNE